MAQRNPPVFRDFLGAGLRVTGKQPELSVTDSVRFSQHSGGLAACEDGEVSTRACSTYSSGSAPGPVIAAATKEFVNSSEHHLELWQRLNTGPAKFLRDKDSAYNGLGHTREKKRAPSPSGSPLRESLQLSKECSEALQSSKISLFDQRDNTGGGSAIPSTSQEDLSLRQQPLESKSPVSIWLQTSVFKTDLTTGASKRVKCSKPTVLNLASSPGTAAGPVNFGALTQVSTSTENTAGGSLLCQLPGDEGSRTGLHGSALAKLLKECPPELPSGPHQSLPFQHHLNLASGNALALPSCSHQISAPASRPLTVFYGGQAHVFDDVSAEKVDAIMMLAGSNGRSWSTIYAPRGSVDEFSSGNDIPLTNPIKKDADKHKDKILVSGTSFTETLSSNLLQSLHRKKVDILQSG